MPDAGSVNTLKSTMSGDIRLRDQDVAREAAQWLMLLHSGEANDNDVQACQRWRVAEPEHECAWQRADRINQKFGQFLARLACLRLTACSAWIDALCPTRESEVLINSSTVSGGQGNWRQPLVANVDRDHRLAYLPRSVRTARRCRHLAWRTVRAVPNGLVEGVALQAVG